MVRFLTLEDVEEQLEALEDMPEIRAMVAVVPLLGQCLLADQHQAVAAQVVVGLLIHGRIKKGPEGALPQAVS